MRAVPILCALFVAMRSFAATHSFEFVAEHLPEAAMDNRYATLPLWDERADAVRSWQRSVQGGFARTSAGGFSLDGPMASLAFRKSLGDRWSLLALGFFDELKFSGGNDRRPLEVLFADAPLTLPADALFTDLRGRARDMGAGLALGLKSSAGWFGEKQWMFGVLWQRMRLQDYRAQYQVLSGPSAGAIGFADYSADYAHLTPLLGLALPHHSGAWSWSPHFQFALPMPQRGFKGRIAGPGFDLSGDTEQAGKGKHFGDPSLTMGFDVTYEPWGLTLDIGSSLSQIWLERIVHKGISQNYAISASWRF